MEKNFNRLYSVMAGFKECLEPSIKSFRMSVGLLEEQSVLVHGFTPVTEAQLCISVFVDQCVLNSGFRGDKRNL